MSSPDLSFFMYFLFFKLILKREEWKERERESKRALHLLFHPSMHPLVDSCVCPDPGPNCNFYVLGRCSNKLSYTARVRSFFKPSILKNIFSDYQVLEFMSLNLFNKESLEAQEKNNSF